VFKEKKGINLKEYKNINNNVSSEMFYNLMSLFHDKLPCSQNFFRLKKIFRTKLRAAGDGSDSPIRSIASPSLMQKNASRKNSVSSFVSSGGASSKSGGRSGKLSAFAGSK